MLVGSKSTTPTWSSLPYSNIDVVLSQAWFLCQSPPPPTTCSGNRIRIGMTPSFRNIFSCVNADIVLSNDVFALFCPPLPAAERHRPNRELRVDEKDHHCRQAPHQAGRGGANERGGGRFGLFKLFVSSAGVPFWCVMLLINVAGRPPPPSLEVLLFCRQYVVAFPALCGVWRCM